MSTPDEQKSSRGGFRRYAVAIAAAVGVIGLLAVFAVSLRQPTPRQLDPSAPRALRDIVTSGATYVSDHACAVSA